MKLISYSRNGKDGFGVLTDNGIVDLKAAFGDRYPTLAALLADNTIETIAARVQAETPSLSLSDVRLLPPIPEPRKIICVGRNYVEHVKEAGRDLPEYPSLFPRYPDSFVGAGEPLLLPKVSTNFDFEGELALVIGKPASKVKAANAFDHIFGYCCANDGTIRDWQRHTNQFLPGKNFRRTGSIGPAITTSDEIADPKTLAVVTRLNGEEMQRATVDMMIFSIPDIMEYITTFTDLAPGDIILTGTPSGVGHFRDPPLHMKDGDRIEVEIEGVGLLSNPVAAERG